MRTIPQRAGFLGVEKMEFDYVVVYMYRESIQVHGIYSEYEDALRAEETLKSCARMSVA